MSHSADNWMPFYGNDFFDDERVTQLDLSDQMLYLRLLWRQWQHGSLPKDPALCARLIGQPDAVERVALLLDGFFFVNDHCGIERLVNVRCAELLAKATERSAKAKRSGVLSAAARAASSSTNAERTLNERSTLRGEKSRGEKRREEPDTALRAETVEDQPRAHHPSESEMAWQSSWLACRLGGEPYELTKADAIALNRIGKKHGTERLRSKADALLGDLDPWVFANASPTLLVKRWSQLGQAVPRRRTQLEIDTQRTLDMIDSAGGEA